MDQNPLMSFDAPLLRLHHLHTCTLAHATEKLQRATIATTFPRLIFPSLDQEGGARCRSLGSNQDLVMSRAVQATVPPWSGNLARGRPASGATGSLRILRQR